MSGANLRPVAVPPVAKPAIAVLVIQLLALGIAAGGEPSPRGPYLGEPTPGIEPVMFGIGTLTTSLHDDCPAVFSPDGKDVYFRKYAIPHDIVGHMTMQDDGTWTEPVLFKPFGDHVFLHPVFIPGNNRSFLNGRRPREAGGPATEKSEIWMAENRGGEWVDWEWSNTLNFHESAGVWSVGVDGTAYLQASADNGSGLQDIYYSRLVDGAYETPRNIGQPVNTAGGEVAPCISLDGSYLIFTDRGREDSLGGSDLYVTFKTEKNSWTEPQNLGAPVNSTFSEKFSAISPDGKYLFYVSTRTDDRQYVYLDKSYDDLMKMNQGPANGSGRGDVYWVSLEFVEALRPGPRP